MRAGCAVGIIVFGLVVPFPAAAQDGVFIAGLHPDVRPAGAPSIVAINHDETWFKTALAGIEPPAPESLRWLADQGDWFTPFIHAGMTGPFDLRGWHSAAPKAAQ